MYLEPNPQVANLLKEAKEKKGGSYWHTSLTE